MLLTAQNYSKGFLLDEELLAGVTEDASQPGLFVAFAVRHTTGQYVACKPFKDLDQALASLNSIKRSWKYLNVSACEKFKRGKAGSCSGGNCTQN